LIDTFWSGELNEKQLINLQNSFASKSQAFKGGFKLSYSDYHLQSYRNEFSRHKLANPYNLRLKERERKRHLSSRFSLNEEDKFTWTKLRKHGYYGPEINVIKVLKMSIVKLVESIPVGLMHRLWLEEKETFLEELDSSTTVSQFAHLLLQFEIAIREPVFSNTWRNSAGLVNFVRMTIEDQEKQSKLNDLRKLENKELQSANPNDNTDIIFLNTHVVNTSIEE